MNKFYLTTAITYTSGRPHIGNVYEIILADAIVRYKKFQGYDTYFMTGTDEHGKKVQDNAKAVKKAPYEFVTELTNHIKHIYELMGIEYDYFNRTTDKKHSKVVQDIFAKLYEQEDIYLGHYEGLYCKSCESFFTDTQVTNHTCPDCNGPVTVEKEEAYFFHLAKYQNRLVQYIKDHPEFIQPESRKNEMLNNFLKDPLPDLCVSRTTFDWGVPVPFNPKHVIYVWIDALANYISGLGFDIHGNHEENYNHYWPANVHLIGKDILRFHTIYWPIMLMALDIPLPGQVFGHPWIITPSGKMSKSKFNVIYPEDLVQEFGKDTIRYYVLHEIPFANDGVLTKELIMERSNTNLANTLGNLVHRTIAMQRKYFPNGVTKQAIQGTYDLELQQACDHACKAVDQSMNELRVSDAIEEIFVLLRRANKYIDQNEPWALAKDPEKNHILENVLYYLLETIRVGGVLLQAFIPDTAKKILALLNTTKSEYQTIAEFGIAQSSYACEEGVALFSRYDIDAYLKTQEEPVVAEPESFIAIEDFDKIEIVVGKILSCERHENAQKLLVSQVDIGTEVRQIVSGIAATYAPEQLVGKHVAVVKNLKEVTLRGVKSNGMILCAGEKNKLEVIELSHSEPGDIIK